MSFAFQRGHATWTVLMPRMEVFRAVNLAFRKPKALRIVRAMEGTQPKVRRLVKALPAKRAWNATRGERRA
jgi:hypothetical protein